MVDKRNSTSVFLKLYFQHKKRRALDVLSSINLRITVKEGKKKKVTQPCKKTAPVSHHGVCEQEEELLTV